MTDPQIFTPSPALALPAVDPDRDNLVERWAQRHGAEVADRLAAAEDLADAEQARAEADQVMRDARAEADRIIRQAQQQASALNAEARDAERYAAVLEERAQYLAHADTLERHAVDADQHAVDLTAEASELAAQGDELTRRLNELAAQREDATRSSCATFREFS
ncbi:hypothetical protein ABT124_40060 [Streptomyces sp. NPDC001982]|uniref:hypothetical protein n=1 Tax=Streptomyces sp. NPDC001982 TaxID=3154405 RepID=UPI00332B8C2D